MTGQVYEDAPAPPAGADPTVMLAAIVQALDTEQLDALISDLQALRATRHATTHRTRVEHEPGAEPRPEDG